MPPGQPLNPGFQISNFLAKLQYINIYHIKKIRTIPSTCSMVSEQLPRQNFVGFGHAPGPALVPHFKF